jgi:hypothetical protein
MSGQYRILQRRPLSARLVFFTAEEVVTEGGGAATQKELVVKESAYQGPGGVPHVRKDVRAGDIVSVEASSQEEQEDEEGKRAASVVVVVRRLSVVERWRDVGGGRTFNWPPLTTATTKAAAAAAADPPPPPSSTPQPPCKYWVNSGRCAKGQACPFAHDAASAAEQREAWVGALRRRRRGGGSGDGGEHDEMEGTAAAKAQRARIFAAWIGAGFFGGGEGGGEEGGPDSVVDVAGGRGGLTFELAALRRSDGRRPLIGRDRVTLVDPRPLRLSRKQALRLRLQARAEEEQEDEAEGGGGKGAAFKGAPSKRQPWRVEDVLTGEVISESRAPDGGGGGGGGGGGQGEEGGGEASAAATAAGNSSSAQGPRRATALFRQARAEFGPTLWRSEAWRRAVEEEEDAGNMRRRPFVAALHPDQATDAALEYALERGLPWAIVPCCVFPELFSERRLKRGGASGRGNGDDDSSASQPVRSYEDLVAWLLERGGPSASSAMLPFVGRNVVVYGAGGGSSSSSSFAFDVMAADRAAAAAAARPPPEFAPLRGVAAGGEEEEEGQDDEDDDDNDDEEEDEKQEPAKEEDGGGGGMFDGAALLRMGGPRGGGGGGGGG